MTAKPVNNDMDMLSVSRIRNLPDAEEHNEPVTKNQLDRSSSFLYVQSTPSSEWVIDHPLNRFPAVTVIDSAGSIVIGNVRYTSPTQCIVSFIGAFSGKASLT